MHNFSRPELGKIISEKYCSESWTKMNIKFIYQRLINGAVSSLWRFHVNWSPYNLIVPRHFNPRLNVNTLCRHNIMYVFSLKNDSGPIDVLPSLAHGSCNRNVIQNAVAPAQRLCLYLYHNSMNQFINQSNSYRILFLTKVYYWSFGPKHE